MTSQCQQCGTPAQGALCKQCAKTMRRQTSSLAKTIPELQALAERKAHIGERGGGSRGGSAGLPLSVHWLEVYEEAACLMLRLAGCVDLRWMLLPPAGWRSAYRAVCRSWSRVLESPSAGELADRLDRLSRRIDRLCTPSDGRVTVVQCPDCSTSLAVPQGMRDGWCPECGERLDLDMLVAGRLGQASEAVMECSPAEAADWLTDRAGLRTTRKQVSNWLARGRLPKARRLGRGVWRFNQAELVEVRNRADGCVSG